MRRITPANKLPREQLPRAKLLSQQDHTPPPSNHSRDRESEHSQQALQLNVMQGSKKKASGLKPTLVDYTKQGVEFHESEGYVEDEEDDEKDKNMEDGEEMNSEDYAA